MYIKDKYWNNYIGDTDDSLTLVEHLTGKQREEIPLGEIFSDFELDKLQGNFRQSKIPLVYMDPEGWETEILYAIDLVTDLAALLLECKKSGNVDLCLLSGLELAISIPHIRITATAEEHDLINRTLMDFASAPLAYDLSEICPEEDMLEMAALCGELRKELYD